MNTKSIAIALVTTVIAAAAFAQPSPPAAGVAVASEPGKAAVIRAAELSASVVGLDKATRTVTLKGPKGDVVDVVASDDVKNFDQIKLGDLVVARYVQALTLELKKTKVSAGDPTVREEAVKAKPGQRPAVAGGRQIAVIADVTEVDPKNGTITLKGPRGNVVKLDVQNPDQFKVVKKGDQVEVTYTEALALSVEPAPTAATAKPK